MEQVVNVGNKDKTHSTPNSMLQIVYTDTNPISMSTTFLKWQVGNGYPINASTFTVVTNHYGKGKKLGEISKLEKELALVKSRLLPNHSLNMVKACTSNTVDVDKGGTQEEDSSSTKIDKDEEKREFNYYMTKQASNNAGGNKNKGGIRVRGRSPRNPVVYE